MIGALKAAALRGGIIAAGDGTRLRADGYRVSKPMAPVAGRPLIAHALDRFRAVDIRDVSVIINETSDDCRQWLGEHAGDFNLDLVVRSTPSSYASFQIVADRLAGAPALITTTDTILPGEDFARFVEAAASLPEGCVALGVTDHVDDENPLWVSLDAADGRVLRLGGVEGSHVTAGLYYLPANRPTAPAAGFARLRDYLQWLVLAHGAVFGVTLPLVFDIDRAQDVEAAETAGFWRQQNNVHA